MNTFFLTLIMLPESVKYVIFDVIPDSGEVRLSQNTTNSIKNKESIVPLSPALMQNYPNPFNPDTRITFQLPTENNVQIKIFNTLGQEIVTLTNGSGQDSISSTGMEKI